MEFIFGISVVLIVVLLAIHFIKKALKRGGAIDNNVAFEEELNKDIDVNIKASLGEFENGKHRITKRFSPSLRPASSTNNKISNGKKSNRNHYEDDTLTNPLHPLNLVNSAHNIEVEVEESQKIKLQESVKIGQETIEPSYEETKINSYNRDSNYSPNYNSDNTKRSSSVFNSDSSYDSYDSNRSSYSSSSSSSYSSGSSSSGSDSSSSSSSDF